MTAIELINIIAPEHDRTSCNDENLDNAFYFNDKGVQERSRCIRCSLLTIANGEEEFPKEIDGKKIFY